MVEDNVKQLDDLNKEAVGQLADLPSNGKVELEAGVSYKNGLPLFEFRTRKITTETSQEIHFGEGYKITPEGSKEPQ